MVQSRLIASKLSVQCQDRGVGQYGIRLFHASEHNVGELCACLEFVIRINGLGHTHAVHKWRNTVLVPGPDSLVHPGLLDDPSPFVPEDSEVSEKPLNYPFSRPA